MAKPRREKYGEREADRRDGNDWKLQRVLRIMNERRLYVAFVLAVPADMKNDEVALMSLLDPKDYPALAGMLRDAANRLDAGLGMTHGYESSEGHSSPPFPPSEN